MGWSMHHPTGLIHYAPQHCYRGYTLFANLRGFHAILIDMQGRVCHRWHWAEGINYGYLLPNGHLLLNTNPPPADGQLRGVGGAAALVELDWEGNLVWEYRHPTQHADFERLPNGNTIVAVWEEIPEELANQVQGGFRVDEGLERILGDAVLEVKTNGEVVHQWRSWEYLNTEEDVICPLEGRREWTHQNALNVTADGDLVVSYRSTSTIGIVDRTTGQFKWKWGPGQVSHQHCPTYLSNGRVLLFDNGPHRPGVSYSRVIEVDTESNEIAWEYRGDPPISFYSYQISGTERLPNGNTLVCEGGPGRIFEVTPNKEIAWEYINPFLGQSGQAVGSTPSRQANSVFRAHRYGPDHPALQGRELDPARYANLNRLYAAG